MSENKTQLDQIIPTRKKTLKILADTGITTLEECAIEGTSQLLKRKTVGIGTVIALRKKCHKRGISWRKTNDELLWEATMKTRLICDYRVSDEVADLVCLIHFTEGWRAPSLPF